MLALLTLAYVIGYDRTGGPISNYDVNCFKDDIKKYFLKKLGETEADIYSYA